MNAPAPLTMTHADSNTIAAALGLSKQAVQKKALKETWNFSEVPHPGGKKRLYPLIGLPKAVRDAVQQHALGKTLAMLPAVAPAADWPATVKKHEVFRADGAMVKRGLVRRAKAEDRMTDIDRARRDGALVLCQAIESALVMSACSAKHAMRELAERVLAGMARPELIDAVAVTYIKPRKAGQTFDALVSRLQKMYAAYLQGRSEGEAGRYLVPGSAEKNQYNPIHIHAFLLHFCRPSRPPVTEAWRAAQAWFAAQSIPSPAVDTFYRIEKSLPVMVKYRGRMTGSEWRGLKPYIARDVSMFYSNDIWVGDGHSFKAKVQHPIHGQPFTPEVTVILDWVSRRIVGWSVDLAESQVAVSAAFRHAQQQTHARPLIYYSDNGSGQTAKTIDCPVHGTMARQGIAHETGIPGNPQARGIIERLWQVTTIPLARTYPTCQWKGADKDTVRRMLQDLNKVQANQRTIVPSFKQFLDDCERVLGWEGEYNRLHAHRELNDLTPMQEYLRRTDPAAEGCGPSDAELAALWRPQVQRTPQRGVVALFNNEYANKKLVDELAEGEDVYVQYDLHDANQVWVYRLDGRFVCIAEWNAHKRAAFPIPRAEQLREARADGKVKRGEAIIAEAKAELGNVIEAQEPFVKTITDFIDLTPAAPKERELTMADFMDEPKAAEKEASYEATMLWLRGEGPDPRSKEVAAGK